MNKKFSFSLVFSIVVLLAFAYITFLGLVYWRAGNLSTPLLITAGLIAIVLLCVIIMCKAKETRWKNIGTFGQIFFGFIVLVAFLLSAVPFTNFLRVRHDKEDISKKVNEACEAAIAMDEAYSNYVDQRLADYQDNLNLMVRGKDISPTEYNECVAGATGATDEEKIAALTKSLHMKLMPDTTAAIVAERQKWITDAKEVKILNPLTPANINTVDQQVNGWLENYQELSSVRYKGEETQGFEYTQFESKLKQLTDTYTKFRFPSIWAILIAIACFGIMLLPYFLTEGDLAAAGGKKKKMKGNGDGNLFNKQ